VAPQIIALASTIHWDNISIR